MTFSADDMTALHDRVHELYKGVKRKGQPGYHRVRRTTKTGKERWEWVHESKLEPHERDAPQVDREREDFIERYFITAARTGVLYDRPMLRAYIRRGMRGFPPEHIAEAVALVDNDAWLRRRRNQTPSSVLADAKVELYGHGRSK